VLNVLACVVVCGSLARPFLCFPLEPPLLPYKILLESHFSITMLDFCQLVAQRHGHVPKVGLLLWVGKAGLAAAGGLSRLFNAVPSSYVRRGNLECHASFNKLVLELNVEVRVKLGFTINSWSSGFSPLVTLRRDVMRLDAGARFIR
jgi:hypothetical protein